MAKLIRLKHRESGVEKQGVIGFSFTTLFFGPIPALLRGDFSTCFLSWGGALLVCVVGSALAGPLGLFGILAWWLYWASQYNTYYTRGLLNQGFLLAGEQRENSEAAVELGIQNSQEYFTGRDTRKCPFCAEMVKIEAIVCRFCHRDLPPAELPQELPEEPASSVRTHNLSPEQQTIMNLYGVEYKDGQFFYQGTKYAKLSDIPFKAAS